MQIAGAHAKARPGEHAEPLGDLDPENELIAAEVPLESLDPRTATESLPSAGTPQRSRRTRVGLGQSDALLDLWVGEIGHREKPTQRRARRALRVPVRVLPRAEPDDPFGQRCRREQAAAVCDRRSHLEEQQETSDLDALRQREPRQHCVDVRNRARGVTRDTDRLTRRKKRLGDRRDDRAFPAGQHLQ